MIFLYLRIAKKKIKDIYLGRYIYIIKEEAAKTTVTTLNKATRDEHNVTMLSMQPTNQTKIGRASCRERVYVLV